MTDEEDHVRRWPKEPDVHDEILLPSTKPGADHLSIPGSSPASFSLTGVVAFSGPWPQSDGYVHG